MSDPTDDLDLLLKGIRDSVDKLDRRLVGVEYRVYVMNKNTKELRGAFPPRYIDIRWLILIHLAILTGALLLPRIICRLGW